MFVLWGATALLLAVSLVASPSKTLAALKVAGRQFAGMLPSFLLMLVLLSAALATLPESAVPRLLGREARWLGVAVAAVLGSVTLMPGFIAFPLCGALLKEGVPYMVLSAFSTTLMTVGVLTYPLESRYFGHRVTLVRNGLALVIALAVALVTGLVFGEIGW